MRLVFEAWKAECVDRSITESMVNGQRQGMTRIDAGVWTDAGKLVVVGTGGDRGFVFQRFNANGSLDTTFGSGGRVLVKFSGVTEYDEPASIDPSSGQPAPWDRPGQLVQRAPPVRPARSAPRVPMVHRDPLEQQGP